MATSRAKPARAFHENSFLFIMLLIKKIKSSPE
jgi:hypothetical protein